jgi:hypothetical protein
MTTPNALHSKKSVCWGTPQWIIESARRLLEGQIHLDPASSPEFNERVQALMIYTEQDDGLSQPWAGNVFCNPPGGKGKVEAFWRRWCEPYTVQIDNLTPLDSVEAGKRFWVGFSIEQLALLAHATIHPMDLSFCILRKRLNFNLQESLEITEGTSPSHSNYVCAAGVDHDLFTKLFQPHGKVVKGPLV